MMKKVIVLFSLCFFACLKIHAQLARFMDEGEIVFEKTTNVHAILKKNISPEDQSKLVAFEAYKKSQEQFIKQKSVLTFNSETSLYRPEYSGLPNGLSYFGFIPWFLQINQVAHSLVKDSTQVRKEILGDIFLVKDKKLKIKWKITDETREIAGYTCRRANGLIFDSIYIVAFFTGEIPVSIGPESFTGLPGMILGAVLPYENVNWFAIEVRSKKVTAPLLIDEVKAKPMNRLELEEKLKSSIKKNIAKEMLPDTFYFGYML